MNDDSKQVTAVPKAFSLTPQEISGDMFAGVAQMAFPMLNSQARSVTLFKTADNAFALGGFEVEIGDGFKREHRYDPFPRNEYMFFTQGGMRFEGDDGTIVEAGPGEMLFIPKGWCGLRIVTGDKQMQKFSVVYYEE